ncbi:hypothetical protein Glove_153g47 [Diversispora epigaea]|uniref:Glycosyl transferase family 25 domain-containing protein n=1 Tax=Diversispora epigaea TaxID=1348612 RepID=A0A397IW94_9GLOM|nr:hypothetical protein Glove_153g47 [Diversispora epigaea]
MKIARIEKIKFFSILIILTIFTFLTENIGTIYVINLDSRTDRKEKMQMKMIANYHNLDFDFFPAVSYNNIETLNKYPSSLLPRQKAYVSHYKIYESLNFGGS